MPTESSDAGAPIGAPTIPVAKISELSTAILERVSTVVVGMEQPLELALASILAAGQVLFEDA